MHQLSVLGRSAQPEHSWELSRMEVAGTLHSATRASRNSKWACFSFSLYFSILINRKYLKKIWKRNFKPKCNSFQEIVWFRWTIFFSWILTFDFFANNSVKNTDKGLISILNNLCVTQHYMVANHNILSLLNIYWKYLEPRHLLAMKKKIVIMGGLLSGSFQVA